MTKTVVLIPHYRNLEGLHKSLASIHTDEKVDILIVDDGSNILLNEKNINNSFTAKGEVFFLYMNKNEGIEKALNTGLKHILLQNKYTYIARLDCGDTCLKNRFAKQETYLERNESIVLVGTFVDFVDIDGKYLYTLKLPTEDRLIRKKMFINAMHIHPTIMFRASMLNKTGLYPTKYKATEDYAFFFKILKYFKVANLNEVLVRCELNENGISSSQRKQQTQNRLRIIKENFYLGFYPIYGFIRNSIIHYLPVSLLTKIKIFLKNG